ncbi:MAG TPA: alpha-hydroxy acid oxidase [Candidatus Limnocylindria bacterium]|nr:alpha-hydroxy acid oxidase [Candidatus Limnocylindria bacterium]
MAPESSHPYPLPEEPAPLDAIWALRDFEPVARDRLHPAAWGYISGGSWDEVTLRDNTAAWDRHRLLPRVLRDVTTVDPSTTLLGRPVALPFGVAPAALHGLAHAEGECATARAAAAAGALFCLSTAASRSIEEVAAAAPDGRRWFQLYVTDDRDLSRTLVQRAARSGYDAIVLTVDLPVFGYREADRRLAFKMAAESLAHFARDEHGQSFEEIIEKAYVPITWDDVDEIASWSSLPLVVKGILHPDDAALAVEHGAAAVWVSNHGGRQLDRAPAAIDALPAVVEAVGGRAEVYVDGGMRRGTHVVTGLALGARAVFAGRPFLWALATAGEPGVARALAILREETELAMALLGARSVAELTPEHVLRRVASDVPSVTADGPVPR